MDFEIWNTQTFLKLKHTKHLNATVLQPAIAFAIREQLYEVIHSIGRLVCVCVCVCVGSFTVVLIHFHIQIVVQSVVSARESRLSKKGRRGADFFPVRFFIHFYPSSVDMINVFIINSEYTCVPNLLFNRWLIYHLLTVKEAL